MKKRVALFFIIGGRVIIFILLIVFYLYLYNLNVDVWKMSRFQKNLFYSWQNRKTAKFLSKLASNSRIYKSYILYESLRDLSTWQKDTWRGERLAIRGTESNHEGDISQGISFDTVNFQAVPVEWDKKNRILRALVNGNEYKFYIDNSTLVYEASRYKPITLIGRGVSVADHLMRGQTINLFVLDEDGLLVILDALILLET
ncbi:hypothetical protein A2971_05180 [Candidatus Gottesmanbacteria bacterium RIFCSPLOWO2_01_FULL_46_21]|uniref:Uncharacterized protein n=1 Tax=Candidatus Gottesmanbacteria bacterium RIFCSPLOWO2_01_FULL_46_21 TaxID=1798393 RepID=A0A1F6AYX8_9BACT|nr:MAG: hypothetical protein A2971_05180 [Candidatus Gottesmanbacteria bacterium RIFCSPLOWO2_01_FULL_46_21]